MCILCGSCGSFMQGVTLGKPLKYLRFVSRFAVSLTVCLGGCAQVTVMTEQAPPQSEWRFGVLALDIPAGDASAIITTSGIGLISSPSGIALGYSKAKIVRISDECRVVIAVND